MTMAIAGAIMVRMPPSRDPQPAQVLLRMSHALRDDLRAKAAEQGVSANHYCVETLARSVGLTYEEATA